MPSPGKRTGLYDNDELDTKIVQLMVKLDYFINYLARKLID